MVVYYINPEKGKDSSDDNRGNKDKPFKTITYALKEKVRIGDEVRLAPGTYNKASGEQFPLRMVAGVRILADETSINEAEGGISIEIQGGGNYFSPSKGWKNATFWIEDINVTLQDITAINPNGFGVWIESPNKIAPIVQNCTFKDCQKTGIFIADGIRPQIINNTISGNGSSGIIVSDTSRPVLRNNLIQQNSEDGLLVTDQALPDLGNHQQRGGNIFINNGHSDFQKYYDLQNASSNTLISNGNQLNPERVKGAVEFLDYKTVTYKLKGRLLNQETNEPLTDYTVRAFDLGFTPAKQLQDTISDSEGRFAIEYKLFLPIEEGSSQTRRFRLHVLNSQGTEFWKRENIEVLPGGEVNLGDIKIDLPTKPSEFTFAQLATALNVQFPSNLIDFLADNQIQSLDQIRRAGGIQQLEGLPDSPEAQTAVQTLESQAYLTLLSSNLQDNAKLLEKGYPNMAAIASRTRSAFVADMAGELSTGQPDLLYQQAQFQMGSLTNILTDLRGDAISYEVTNYNAQLMERIESLFSPKCNCPDSESAVSPIAYLADLLNYILLHVRNKESQEYLDLNGLEERLHQPFSQYPASSEQVDRKVRQVRICIEVLRNYLKSKSLTVNPDAYKTYLFEAYRALLNQIGTSYDAIRSIKTAEPKERQALAERLGISLHQNRPDQLDELFLTKENITEQQLEQMFGLVDTSRNPLCDGVQVGEVDERIRGWNFTGLEWNRNTDAEGNIYGILGAANLSPQENFYKLYLYTNPAKLDEQLVASSGEETLEKTFILSQQNNSGLSAQFNFDSEQEPITDQFVISAIPSLLCWRLQHLRHLWRGQDWPADAYGTEPTTAFPEGDLLPAIDPDLIGPDDFREPFAKGSEDNLQVPFDLWLKRRKWIDRQLEELRNQEEADKLAAVLQRMLSPINYQYKDKDGNSREYAESPWPFPFEIDWFDEIKRKFKELSLKLERGQDLEETKREIQTDLKLTVDSFKRLVQIQSQSDFQEKDPSKEEWEELFSILVQAQKVCLFPTWRDEEQVFSVLFSPQYFWMALRQPQEGNWPPILSNLGTLIEPDLLKLTDLPEPTAGESAIALWQARREQIEQTYTILQTKRETDSFEAMLVEALGTLPPAAENTWPSYLEKRKEELDSGNDELVPKAKEAIANILCMTLQDFTHLMEIKAKSEAGIPQNKPTQQEWAEVYTILTQSYKFKQCYPQWVTDEQPLKYWQKLKAKLPRWRATPEARALWQYALRLRSQAPIVDPDLISSDDLRHKIETDPAYNILQERKAWIKGQKESLKTTLESASTPKNGFNEILSSTIGVQPEELLALANQQKQGDSIAARLDQLSLEMGDFLLLMRIYSLLLLESEEVILPSEWEEVYTILVQVTKRRTFAEWQEEEKAQGIILSPDFCQIPDQEPTGLSQSLGIRLARRDWQDKLSTRIDQEKSVWTALSQAVDACEEATLLLLRDALIDASDASGSNTTTKAKWLSEQLSLDCQTGSCQKTTRISQAMVTLQNFIFSLRTGQSESSKFELTEDEHFDREWQWIGSYEPWKAAMGVFLYPENILLPSLRRQKTPAFRQLIEQLRTNRNLTPENARQFARNYADYFNDVSNLTIKATCIAYTQITRNLSRDLFYIFALSPTSNKVYWWVYDTIEGEAGYSQNFWQTLPNLENTLDIIGAVPYRAAGVNFIYLFVKTQKDDTRELVFLRYNLDISEKQRWEEVPTSLKLPENATNFTGAVLKQGTGYRSSILPEVVIQLSNGAIYTRLLNQSGDDWNERDWELIVHSSQGKNFEVCALIEIESEDNCLIISNNNILKYRRFGKYDDGYWQKIGDGDYSGTFLFMNPLYIYVYVFFTENSSCRYKLLDFSNTPESSSVNLTLSDLEDWLKNGFSVSLKQISIVSPSFSYECFKEAEDESDEKQVRSTNFSGNLFKLLQTRAMSLMNCTRTYGIPD